MCAQPTVRRPGTDLRILGQPHSYTHSSPKTSKPCNFRLRRLSYVQMVYLFLCTITRRTRSDNKNAIISHSRSNALKSNKLAQTFTPSHTFTSSPLTQGMRHKPNYLTTWSTKYKVHTVHCASPRHRFTYFQDNPSPTPSPTKSPPFVLLSYSLKATIVQKQFFLSYSTYL